MDDDSTIATPLDKLILSTDKFVAGKEAYEFDDRCYENDFVSAVLYVDNLCVICAFWNV